jgi:hypothetical protein
MKDLTGYRTLRQKKKNKTNEISSNDASEQQCPSMSSIEIFTVVMRTIIEARQKNIRQRTEQLMKFTNTIDDNGFF